MLRHAGAFRLSTPNSIREDRMTINRPGNGPRTVVPNYAPSRPVNAPPAKETGWAGYCASSRKRTEAARSHVDQSVGDKWRNKIKQPPVAHSGRATASTPHEFSRPPVQSKGADEPSREVFKRSADSSRESGKSKATTTRDETVKPSVAARTKADDISLPMIDTNEEEEVLASGFRDDATAPSSISPEKEMREAIQKLVDQYSDSKSPVHVHGLVYDGGKLTGLILVKRSASERLAKQHRNDPTGLRTALDKLGRSNTKTLQFSDLADWKNTRLNAALKKNGATLDGLFKEMTSAFAKVRSRQALSTVSQAIDLMKSAGDLQMEGVFRLAAPTGELTEIFESLLNSSNLQAALPKPCDLYTRGDVIKRTLRELPERVLSGQDKSRFLALENAPDDQAPELYANAINVLSDVNRQHLGTLMRFLKSVAAEKEKNKMGVDNLGTIFASVLMDEEAGNMDELQRTTIFKPVVNYMIEHADDLFPDSDTAAPSPKKAATAQVKAKAGAATLAKAKPPNVDGTDGTVRSDSSESSSSDSSASTGSGTAIRSASTTTGKASPPKPLVTSQKNASAPALAAAPKTKKISKAEEVKEAETIVRMAYLRKAQSAVDAANFIMTYAAKELGDDWRWEPENSPLRALLQSGISVLYADKHRNVFWDSREKFLIAAEAGTLQAWLQKAVTEVKASKSFARHVAQAPGATQSDVDEAERTYKIKLERFKTNQIDFTLLYAVDALTKGMANQEIETLNEIVDNFAKRNPDGTPVHPFGKYDDQIHGSIYKFYSSVNSLLKEVAQRAAPGKEKLLAVDELVKNLYLFAFAPLGETNASYLTRRNEHATTNNNAPMTLLVASRRTQAMAINLLSNPEAYFPQRVKD
jgi:hypothetical protein